MACGLILLLIKTNLQTITNDLSSEFDTDYHLDALEFMKMFDTSSVDGVLYDPPYSPRQVSECYNNVGYNVTWDTTKASFWGNHKREISRIVKIGGKVITFGWNSGGIGYKYGFEIERLCWSLTEVGTMTQYVPLKLKLTMEK